MMGGCIGRVLYYLPTSWKAKVYISTMKEEVEKELSACHWVLSDKKERTVGMFGLSEIDKSLFDIDPPLKPYQLFNVGVMLHSDFQRREVITQLTNELFDSLTRLKIDMDGLWIATRTDNQPVNHIAEKLEFTLHKTMRVEKKN